MSLKSPIGIKMLSEMPSYYRTSRVMKEGILEPEGRQLDTLNRGIEDVFAQFFVRTATWGLDIWESELAINRISPNETLDERRDRIVAKERASSTATIHAVESTAQGFSAGKVQVIPDPIEGVVIVRFIDTRGVPSNIDDFKASMREIIPSHFNIIYEYNYLTWGEYDEKNLTFGDLDDLNITFGELEVLK